MAYNSQHTGTEIDDAILAVLQKESIWDNKADRSTTLSGYGIANAYTIMEIDAIVESLTVSISGRAPKATTLSGYGITDAYTIAQIDELLGGKLNSNANAVSASKWNTARTITLNGDVSGSVTMDGSTNVTLTVTVKDDSHNHTIENIDGLQSILDTKVETLSDLGITATASELNKLDGCIVTVTELNYLDGVKSAIQTQLNEKANAATTLAGYGITDAYSKDDVDDMLSSGLVSDEAAKWSTPRTITLAGDATGSVTMDGSANVTLIVTVVDDSHNHTIENIDGLQAALNEKIETLADLGITATASELNKLDGCKVTTAELNFLDGVTSAIQTQLNNKADSATTLAGYGITDAYSKGEIDDKLSTGLVSEEASKWSTARTITLAGDASGAVSIDGSENVTLTVTVKDDSHAHVISNIDGLQAALNAKIDSLADLGITATASELNKLDGCTATVTELNYLDGVTSAIQTQLNNKLGATANATSASKWANARTITLNGDASGSVSLDGSANVTLTVTVKDDSHAHVISNIDGLQSALDAKVASLSDLGITATASELNKLDGCTATVAELNYLDGVTSSIQTQLNGKASNGHTHNYAGSLSAGGAATSANKLASARTITLAGDLSGSVTFDGSANVTLTATVKDDSHAHVIGNVDGLQSALNGKMSTASVSTSDITAGSTSLATGRLYLVYE